MQGLVKFLVNTHENREAVMRFVLETEDGGSIPCEMRGDRILGVLNNSDDVELLKGRRRNSSGIICPVKIRNHTTRSEIRVKRRGTFRKFVATLFSFVASIVVGVITALIVNSYGRQQFEMLGNNLDKKDFQQNIPMLPDNLPLDLNQIPLAVLLGILAAVLVFLMLVSRRR